MKIAVVTPVGPGTDPDHLQRCADSVAVQTHPVVHILVMDGADVPAYGTFQTIRLPHAAADIDSTPRLIGSAYAFGQGFVAVCWLDADNWFLEDHVTRLVRLHHDTGAPVCCSGRYIVDQLGREDLRPCIEQVEGSGFYDTNTAMVTDPQFAMLWGMLKPNQHIIGDRIVLGTAAQREALACHYRPTVVYRSRLKFHYDAFGWDTAGVDLEVKEFTP